ncbi:hypothetical protein [Streptomyces sp. NPDC051310]|uniref:hypothetical protein n=1 Tax=Streptomyces sp. NPDC051310 TaxID=3365649 RepID=UPI0037878FFC
MRLVHSLGLTSAALLLLTLLPATGTATRPGTGPGASPGTWTEAGTGPGRAAAARSGTGSDTGPVARGPSYGPAARLGNGRIRVFTDHADGRPRSLGVVLTASALTGLPTAPTDGEHCLDADGDGRVHPSHECVGGHGLELPLPDGARSGLPFHWVLFNWNPEGHRPHGRYDVPHFDVHFYLVPRETRDRIRIGRCALLIDCAQLPAAAAPVPAAHLPAGYPASSPETSEGAMGEHLDSRPPTAGALAGHTFIYGAYAGDIVFMEPMLTKTFLEHHRTTPPHRTCAPVPQPRSWRTPGWYPTRYCMAYRPDHDDYTVTLTDFRR